MSSRTVTLRTGDVDLVASTLLARASKLSRLLLSAGDSGLSRTEAALLGTLSDGSLRITELAASEALAQPTVTRVVDSLERRGLVERQPNPDDRRVVLVASTPAGREALAAARAWNSAQMRELLSDLDDREVAELASASQSLEKILAVLGSRGTSR
jgi:DNA-binding MarR family transcriptional regulator